jgi:type II secretory pathway pseudopilin PulG
VVRRNGFSMVEIVLAVALFGGSAVALLSTLTQGAAGAARASEAQLATVLAARVMDRMLGAGYAGLNGASVREGNVELPALDGSGAAEQLVADGIEYRATYAIENPRDDLVKLAITLTWKRAGSIGAKEPGTMKLMRYVANPAKALDTL